MAGKRKASLETNSSPDVSEFRRDDSAETPPDSLPPRDGEATPAGGGIAPTADGGNEQHPVHDDDQEDATPETYERELDRLDSVTGSLNRQ